MSLRHARMHPSPHTNKQDPKKIWCNLCNYGCDVSVNIKNNILLRILFVLFLSRLSDNQFINNILFFTCWKGHPIWEPPLHDTQTSPVSSRTDRDLCSQNWWKKIQYIIYIIYIILTFCTKQEAHCLIKQWQLLNRFKKKSLISENQFLSSSEHKFTFML